MTVQGKPGIPNRVLIGQNNKRKMNQNKKTMRFSPVYHVLPSNCRNLVAYHTSKNIVQYLV